MDAISNVDRLMLILRQRLAERAKASGPRQRSAGGGTPAPLNIRSLAAINTLDDRQFKRALIQSILTDAFGADMINEAKFQQVVNRVTDALSEDEATSSLLNRVTKHLRDSVA